METNNKLTFSPEFDIDTLTGKLQKEDTRNLRISKIFLWVMGVMAVLYFMVFVVIPDSERTFNEQLGGAFYALSFLLFAIIFKILYDNYRSIDYGEPTMEMLRKAAKRYKLSQTKTYYAIVPVVFNDLGLCFMSYEKTSVHSLLHEALRVQLFYIPLMTAAFCVGVFIWWKRQKPLRDSALALLREFEV